MRWSVILAGGSGTRFWPLSTPEHPKQLLPLTGEESTAEEAVSRLDGLIERDRILLVTGQALAGPLASLLRLPPENLLIEPRPASTGPALVWATWEARRRDPDAEILSLHADWSIRDAAAFRTAAAQALETARKHAALVTVGIVPTRPETGYGYIMPGPTLDDAARHVARFVEKPDAATALTLMAEGAYWNSGLFAWTGDTLLREVKAHTPEIAPHLAALEQGDVESFFSRVTPVSIDVGVLERSTHVAVVPGAYPWDDVGTWDALARVRQRDAEGNVKVGPVYTSNTRDCIIWSDGEPLVVNGVQDLVIVSANGRTLVMHRSKAAELKRVLDGLPDAVREVRSEK
ncbi:MAG: mannose-1-phosphate guanylyltransferase [Gemmatimonadales bacterium]